MTLGTIRRTRSSIILCFDLISAIAIFSGVYFLRLNNLPDYLSIDLWLIVSTFILTLFLSGTYFRERSSNLPALPIRTFFICLFAGSLCILWVYLLGPNEFNRYFGRGVLPAGTILLGISTTLIRFGINRLYHQQEQTVEVLYLGYSKSTEAFLQELNNHAEIRSATIVSDDIVQTSNQHIKLAKPDELTRLLSKEWQCVIIDPEHKPDNNTTTLLVTKRLSGTPVYSLADYYEKNWYMVPVLHIGDEWFLKSQGFSMVTNPVSLRVKRLLDIILAAVLLVTLSPIILICGLLIKATSRGAVFFSQKRVGMQGEIFTIHKLRTMVEGAEIDGAQWAQDNDPRVTRFGNFLRKSRLDELPQCWNVLKGEMSFIGPRPERPEFTEELSQDIPYYDLRHTVKPGISGWAQVIFPYGASVEDSLKKLQYELYYIKYQSLLLDLNIMVRTLFTVFQRAGR